MTAFEYWVLVLLTVGVTAVCFYLWWGYRHDTALTQRDEALDDLTYARADIDHAHNLLSDEIDLRETARRELEQMTSLYTTEADRCLELEQRLTYMIDPDDITPGLELLNQLGQAAYNAWQTAGGRGRTTPERELLNHFAPTDDCTCPPDLPCHADDCPTSTTQKAAQ